ncbi:MAG: PAM68 family protein [Xenococcaceae cyanobacterium]
MSSEDKRGRLPFEPRQNKKKNTNKASAKVENKSTKTSQKSETKSNRKGANSRQVDSADASLSAIPDVVSKRMARRMALFCGIPTSLGISSFFIFYWISSNQWLVLPPYLVLFVSFSLFGLGFVGLSYGIFSASWDETQAGSWLGLEQIKTNWQRTTSAWKSSRKSAKGN